MTSLAENSKKQLEIARNEQNLISNSFRSTIKELKQSGKLLDRRKTTSMEDDLYGR